LNRADKFLAACVSKYAITSCLNLLAHALSSGFWLKNCFATVGGFIVFCDYIVNNNKFFLIAMIKKKNGVTISNKLEPEEMIHL
ncbi:hypothetical protein ACSLNS_24770, partial [Escherichia coli]